MPPAELIERLGGRAGVANAVYDLYDRLLGDELLSPYFADVVLPDLRNHMVDFLVAAVTGRTDGYRGAPLAVAHRGLGITDQAFDRVIAHLQGVLVDLNIDAAAATDVLSRLRPLRTSVVI